MKNRKGSGSLFQRGGIWFAMYKFRGTRYRWSSHSRRKTDAADMLKQKIREIHEGAYRPWAAKRSETTVKDLAEKWLATYVKAKRNIKGQSLTKYRVDTYLLPYMGNVPASNVTMDTLRRYVGYLQSLSHTNPKTKAAERDITDLTVRHIVADAKCLFIWAHAGQHIAHLPIPKGLLPKKTELLPRALSREEQAAVSALPDPYGFACRVMLETGVRWSELCRLTSADVIDGAILVHGATKSGKMRRIPVPPALLAELKGHVGKLVPFAGTKGTSSGDNPAFCRSVQRATKGTASLAEHHFSAHRCRHSFAVNYLMGGGNIKALQEMMGHASIETTALYLRLVPGLVQEDARRVWERRQERAS